MLSQKTIDINCDLGESFGVYQLGMDDQVIKYVSSVNIACGFHAGDPGTIRNTISLAGPLGLSLGAHPSFPDLLGFGRRKMDVAPTELENYLLYQIGAVKAITEALGYRLNHVKPHGALYNMAVTEQKLAKTIVESVALIDDTLIIIAPHHSEMFLAAQDKGIRVAKEFFADRNYNPDGTLVSRNDPKALLTIPESACARAVTLVKTGQVQAVDGSILPMKADTICVHGDNPAAVSLAKELKETFIAEGIRIVPLR